MVVVMEMTKATAVAVVVMAEVAMTMAEAVT
jgi:hypothetical protein